MTEAQPRLSLVADVPYRALTNRRLATVHTLMVAGGSPGISAALESGAAAAIVARAQPRVARLASVSPASPENTSSEPSLSCQSATVLVRPGSAFVRTPISEPLDLTSGVTGVIASPVCGLTRVTVPRASLLWKPSP